MDWKTEEWPDWADDGKRVEIMLGNGSLISGKLIIDDFFPDGQGDEYPVFSVRSDDGYTHSFADQIQWRFER